MRTMTRFILLVLVTVVVLDGPGWAADEARSFLSFPQKGELIWNGAVTSRDGERYEIFVVPGYRPPMLYASHSWAEGGNHFLDYVRKDPYVHIWEGWQQSGRGYRNVAVDWLGHGNRAIWVNSWTMARNAKERGAFGWYLAYPYAFVKSLVLSAFNVGASGVAFAGVTAYGAALRPAYELASPAVRGIWDIGPKGTVVPVVKMGWNTVAAPPLSLLEYEPTPQSADGYWVRALGRSEGSEVSDSATLSDGKTGKRPD